MPNTYLTLIEQEAADGSIAVLKDYTEWTDPVRNTRALFLKLTKRDAAGVETDVTIDNGTPLSVTQWNFNLAGGGTYVATFYVFPIWSAGTYNLNACVFYATTGKYYRCKADAVVSNPSNATDWEWLTDPTTVVDIIGSNTEVSVMYNFTTYDAEIKVADELETLSDQIIDGRPKDWEDTTMALLGVALANGAWVKHYRVKNDQAQTIVDFLNQKYPSRI